MDGGKRSNEINGYSVYKVDYDGSEKTPEAAQYNTGYNMEQGQTEDKAMLQQVSAEVVFACVESLVEDDADHCSTLSASCAEDKKIMIDKIHSVVKNGTGTCSTNVTNCKTFLHGCCAYTENDKLDLRSTTEVWSIHNMCEGKRNCTFKPSGMDIDNLGPKGYIMFEYFCVNDTHTIHLHMCNEVTTKVNTKQANFLYTGQPAQEDNKDHRRKCTCNISPTNKKSGVELSLTDVQLMDQNQVCSTTTIKLSDNVILACGVFSGLSIVMEDTFTIELDISAKQVPGSIQIAAKAIDGVLEVNCWSQTYNASNISGSGDQSNKTASFSGDCPKCDTDNLNLSVVIAVPLSAIIIAVAIVIATCFVVKTRCTTNKTKAKHRKEVNSVDSPFYHVLEAQNLEVYVRNSSQMSVSGNIINVRSTNNGTQSREIQPRGTADDNTNQLNPPVVSHYERISLSNDDPNVRYTSYSVDQSADKNLENTSINLSVAETNMQITSTDGQQSDTGIEIKSIEPNVPASYDKISFSKPPSYKLSTYHTIEGTLPRDTKPV